MNKTDQEMAEARREKCKQVLERLDEIKSALVHKCLYDPDNGFWEYSIREIIQDANSAVIFIKDLKDLEND